MKSKEQKDHELGITAVCEWLKKQGDTIRGVNVTLGQFPQIIAEVDGQLTFIVVKAVRYPEESILDENLRVQLLEHVKHYNAVAAFAPVGLWPTEESNEAGEEGFYVKYEGLERFNDV